MPITQLVSPPSPSNRPFAIVARALIDDQRSSLEPDNLEKATSRILTSTEVEGRDDDDDDDDGSVRACTYIISQINLFYARLGYFSHDRDSPVSLEAISADRGSI